MVAAAGFDRQSEAEAVQRALTALSRATDLAFGAEEERPLYQALCDMLVAEAGYVMAWVGFPDHGPERRVIPIVSSGDASGYLSRVAIRWDDSPAGSGPTGLAIRRGQTQINNDTGRSANYGPWREEALRAGFQASIAIPLRHNGQVIAVLCAYGARADAFMSTEKELLERVAEIVAFAAGALRERLQRREAEAALDEMHGRFRATFEHAPIGIAHCSMEGRWLLVNTRLCEILGYSREQLLRLRFQDVTYPGDLPASDDALPRLLAGKIQEFTAERRFLRPDGQAMWVRVTAALVENEGAPIYFIATFEDINARKRAEEGLLQTMAQFQALVEATPDMIFVHGRDGQVLDVNDKTVASYGFTRDEMRTLPFASFTGEGCTMEQAGTYMRRALAGEPMDFEWTARRKSGEDFPVEVRLRRLQHAGDAHLVAVVRDISERRQAEAALRESEERFRSLVETTADWVWEVDAQGRYTYCSPRVREILGHEPAELLGKTPFDFMRPAEAERIGALFRSMVARREPFYCLENVNVHRDGHAVILETSGAPFFNAEGEFLGYRGIDRDVTPRYQAERQLREQDELYHNVVRIMTEGVIVQDRDACIVAANPSACRLLGLEEPQLRGRSCVDPSWRAMNEDGTPLAPADHPSVVTLREGRPQHDKVIGVHRPDGTLAWLSINTQPLMRTHETMPYAVVTSITDITERKHHLEKLHASFQALNSAHKELKSMHAQLLHSEKMASVGHLAAGIAHEINNPVGYVNANLGTLEEYLGEINTLLDAYEGMANAIGDHPATLPVREARKTIDIPFLREDIAALLRESREGITRVRNIVQDLKDFSRADEAEWQWSNLNKGLDSTLNIVWNELKYKATITRNYGELPEVECVPSQLNQVFMNLLVNAGQAIKSHGEITIATGVRDEQVWISVSDTGGGIPAENMSKLFDPFFTTKPVGQGTGLGLSISYSIVSKHHGRIEVESELDKGTTFTVWLPVHQPEKRA